MKSRRERVAALSRRERSWDNQLHFRRIVGPEPERRGRSGREVEFSPCAHVRPPVNRPGEDDFFSGRNAAHGPAKLPEGSIFIIPPCRDVIRLRIQSTAESSATFSHSRREKQTGIARVICCFLVNQRKALIRPHPGIQRSAERRDFSRPEVNHSHVLKSGG